MAEDDGRRVRYLADFGRPVGGPAAGRARVLCHETDVYLAGGTEFVYVYDREGKRLQAVYRFPDQVWHLELLALQRELYVLCARNGIFRLPLDRPTRSGATLPRDSETREAAAGVAAVGPEARVLADPALCAFAVLAADGGGLVTLAPGPATWTLSLFELPLPAPGPRPPTPAGRVVFPAAGGDPRKPPAPRSLPVLCCVSPPGGAGGPRPTEALWGLLSGGSGAAAAVLCGLPDGRLCRVALPAPPAPGDPVRLLHRLEEPVAFVGALRTAGPGGPGLDCVVAVGHGGRVTALRAGEAGVPELRDYRLPGPVLCAACGAGSRLYVGTRSDLAAVDLAAGAGGRPPGPGEVGDPPAGLPPVLAPAGLRICGAVTLAVSAGAPEGEVELLALSVEGRLMICRLGPGESGGPEETRPARGTVARSGQRIRDLLSGIGNVSERERSLKKAEEQRNRALAGLNEALNVSCALLGGPRDPRPIGCTIRAAWTPPGALAAVCVLHNAGAFGLDRGWTLCVRLVPAARPLDGGPPGPATYSVPLGPLAPGGRREVTLPLAPDPGRPPALPVTVSCSLFYGLGAGPGPADPAPGREGVCLPLGRHSVDILQCLRFPGPAPAPAPGPAPDPVDAFLGGARAEPLVARSAPPSVATLKVSSRLLRDALRDRSPLCCGTLRWLLAENGAADAVRTRAVSAVRAAAPDGNDVHLLVREVAVTELCPEGPVAAVEIRMESSTLANLCRLHHAVVQRFRVRTASVMDGAGRGPGPPPLRLHPLRQIHSNHEMLLKEVRTLRDHPGREDDAGAAAERLLRLYGQLRDPSLILL
uniref:FA core complex associated protein 100 n=1 Tax=Ornithorhynchus anatinus TaxID=9258 RepID=A0A6I8P5X1_ORNAN